MFSHVPNHIQTGERGPWEGLAGVQSCKAECSLQAGLGFRSALYHQSIVQRGATGNCVKNEYARKRQVKKLRKSKLKIRQLE